MRFSETVAAFFGRVELLALGAEDDRKQALSALQRGDAMAARAHARSLLARVLDSKIGLALLADAAEASGLAEEAATALAKLADAMPWLADPWLRLGHALAAAEAPEDEVVSAFEKAAMAPEGEAARKQALLWLCDRDLASNDPARAYRWLLRLQASDADPEVRTRLVEHALRLGEVERARALWPALGAVAPTDGRRALLEGRLRALVADPSAFDWLLRAFLLDADGAADAFATYLASSRDAVELQRARAVLQAAGRIDEPRWAAAFALSEGRRSDARKALREGARAGDADACRTLLDLALREHDEGALFDALDASEKASRPVPAAARALASALEHRGKGAVAEALDTLDAVEEGPVAPWRDALRDAMVRELVPAEGEARWPELFAELWRAAKALDRHDLFGAIEAIAVERERPLRVAVVGEFNAGKSTFLNALLDDEVAPTGVLPTTACLHWVAYAEDAFARIVVRNAAERVVTHAELKAALRELDRAGTKVERVHIHAPIERLRRIEVLDTPGLNSGDAAHTEASRAAFEEAHLAVWLLDLTQPFKESERRILADAMQTGLPIWVLANKRDRLSEEDAERAFAYVRESLDALGLRSFAEPLAISAKAVIAGRRGDAQAWERSGWAKVEEVLDAIVARRVPLRERALRRRALRVAAALAMAAGPLAEAEERASAQRRDLERTLGSAAARLEAADAALLDALRASLREPWSRLEADLAPLGPAFPDALTEGAMRYVTERAVARLAEPLAVAVTSAVGLEEGLAAALLPQARALVAGAFAVSKTRPDADRLMRAATWPFARALRELMTRPPSWAPAKALRARLDAIARALSCGREDAGPG